MGRLKMAEETPPGRRRSKPDIRVRSQIKLSGKRTVIGRHSGKPQWHRRSKRSFSAKSLRYLRQRQGRRNLPSFLIGQVTKNGLELIRLYEINSRILIVSNNPSLGTEDHIVHLGEAGVLAVMKAVRGYLHKGHRLLTHPLAGSVKPNENPYKSIVITSQSGILDFESVSILEGAIKLAERMLRESPPRPLPEQVLSDLALIDHSLLMAGLESLAASPWTI